MEARTKPEGTLFDLPAIGLREEREELRRTIAERCEMAAELVDHGEPAVVWCHLNDEGDRLDRLIPDAVQVKRQRPHRARRRKLLPRSVTARCACW